MGEVGAVCSMYTHRGLVAQREKRRCCVARRKGRGADGRGADDRPPSYISLTIYQYIYPSVYFSPSRVNAKREG